MMHSLFKRRYHTCPKTSPLYTTLIHIYKYYRLYGVPPILLSDKFTWKTLAMKKGHEIMRRIPYFKQYETTFIVATSRRLHTCVYICVYGNEQTSMRGGTGEFNLRQQKWYSISHFEDFYRLILKFFNERK